MGHTTSNVVYLFITMLWSGIIFTVLLPDVKNYAYSKCVWKFNFMVCDKFLGIEGGYRFTLSICLFYLLLSLVTINYNPKYATWIHQECWILKFILFIATNAIGFLVPFSRLFMDILYNVFLCCSVLFIVAMFILTIDGAHALKLFWLRKAKATMDTPTCYLCTWLFVLHIATSFLYAISLDVILAFFFFNNIEECVNTLFFVGINVCVCCICYGLSYFPSLCDRQSSSQIIFASVLYIVTFSTWIALSDPENEYCNMYGTIFTGSILESSTSFRSLVSVVTAVPPLLFLCVKGATASYIRSLLTNSISSENSLHIYSSFHIIMTFASCYILMSVTNVYEPVYTIFTPLHSGKKALRTAVIYFEGYNWNRFVGLCVLSTFLPLFYMTLLIICITRDCMSKRQSQKAEKSNRKTDEKSVLSDATDEFLYVEVSKEETLKMLRKTMGTMTTGLPDKDINYLLLQCFYVTETNLSFWLFPRHICQTYFKGRNGSNACTIIAMIIGRFFSRSEIPYQNIGYLGDTWLNLFYASIEEGNSLYDSLVKDLGVLDLSIEEVTDRLGMKLNVKAIMQPLAVSFESDVESATILFQLRRLIDMQCKRVVLFIHKRRTSAILIYENGKVIYTDSHAFGDNGALMVAFDVTNLVNLVEFLKDVLGSNNNKLATLTVVEYEDRKTCK